jgi:putative ABC transport system permease protein
VPEPCPSNPDADGEAGIAAGRPTAAQIRRQIQLPLPAAARIAWRNLRVRLGRSVLVTGGIVLALAFLTYLLCSDALMRQVAASGPPALVERLRAEGALAELTDADARVQTWWLVALALLVSFVGVLNAMLLSISERIGEIGTMKCLGALDSLIVKLFLLESLFQGVVGAAVGVAIGLALTLVEGVSLCGGQLWRLIPHGRLAALAALCLAAGTALTVAAALYPTWRAARMQPVDAMRTEV